MTNPKAMRKSAVVHGMIFSMLHGRSQAAPILTRKQLKRELAKMGYPEVSLDTIRRCVISIRGKGVRNL
jgi:hypothetical protein